MVYYIRLVLFVELVLSTRLKDGLIVSFPLFAFTLLSFIFFPFFIPFHLFLPPRISLAINFTALFLNPTSKYLHLFSHFYIHSLHTLIKGQSVFGELLEYSNNSIKSVSKNGFVIRRKQLTTNTNFVDFLRSCLFYVDKHFFLMLFGCVAELLAED